MKRWVSVAFVMLFACSDPAPSADPSEPESPDITGTYRATIPASTFRGTELPRSAAGNWRLEIREGEYEINGPVFRVTEELEVTSEDSLIVRDVPAPLGAYNCYNESDERLMPPTKVEAIYSYTLEDGVLEVRAEEEPCLFRDLLFERKWELKS